MKNKQFTKIEIQNAIQNSTSLRSVGKLLKITNQTAKRWIAKYNLNIEHFSFGKKYSNTIGKKYNLLTILNIFKNHDGHRDRWYAECSCDCGRTGIIKRLDTTINGRVPSCGCISKNRPEMNGMNNPAFNGVGELRSMHYRNIVRGASRRGISFNLTKKYLWHLYQKQNRKCAISGMPIQFGRVHFSHETTCSLDRIDNNVGYKIDNVQWVHKDINKLKHDFDQEYFIKLCKMIAENNK